MREFVLGLDLGQAQDYSALALLQAEKVPDEGLPPPREGRPDHRPLVRRYSVRHLRRWQLGTKYGEVVKDVERLLTDPPQPPAPHGRLVLAGSDLVIDQTGVGAAVAEMFEEARLPAKLRQALITAGHVEGFADGHWNVPKKHLVGVLQVLLQSRRLLIGKGLPLAETLAKELTTFKVKVTTAGNESFEAWRERDHDDLVLAVALACWWAERNAAGGGALPLDLTRRPNDPPPLWQQGRGFYGRPG